MDYARAELQHQNSENQKPHSPAEEDRQQKMADAHLRHRRGKRKNLKRSRWRKHCGKHQAPKRMLIEGIVHLFEARCREPLPQQLFASRITNPIHHKAAQGRPGSGHQHIEQPTGMVLCDIAANHDVHGKTECGTVECGHRKHSPNAEGLQNVP